MLGKLIFEKILAVRKPIHGKLLTDAESLACQKILTGDDRESAKQLLAFYEKTQASQEALQDRLVSMVEDLAAGLANKNTTQTVTGMAQKQLSARAQVQSIQSVEKVCGNCGYKNSASKKFCSECGSPL